MSMTYQPHHKSDRVRAWASHAEWTRQPNYPYTGLVEGPKYDAIGALMARQEKENLIYQAAAMSRKGLPTELITHVLTMEKSNRDITGYNYWLQGTRAYRQRVSALTRQHNQWLARKIGGR